MDNGQDRIASHPLADLGWLFRFANESLAQDFHFSVQKAAFPWVRDLVPAYKTVAVFHNPALIAMGKALETLQTLKHGKTKKPNPFQGKEIIVPCCYQLGPDLDLVAEKTLLTTKEVIQLHSETIYLVYAIGFTPGFPYLGYLPEKLQGVPRLATPRVKVEAGSVGMTGVQTGIYPEEKPGGWNLVGCTPMRLVDLEKGFFAFQTGDRVKFEPITLREFRTLEKKTP